MILPWPPKELNPNARVHHMKKASVVKRARSDAFFAAAQHGERVSGTLYAIWTFYPPDKRKRDLGNLRAACKSFQDGVFDWLGLDDSLVKEEHLRWGEKRKPGEVELELYDDYKAYCRNLPE